MAELFTQFSAVLMAFSALMGTVSQNPTAATNQNVRAQLSSLTAAIQTISDEMAVLQNASSTAEIAIAPQIAAPVVVTPPVVSAPVVTPAVPANIGAAPDNGTAPEPKRISVSFNEANGTVTITNDTGVRVRVTGVKLSGGTLAGFGFNDSQYQYSPSFSDSTEKTFVALACTGLGSEGMARLPLQGPSDPCRRKDANLARNEIEPGEAMTLRYGGSPTAVVYQSGSIVEAATGNDVQF